MKAAWYEKQGAARDVLILGKTDDPQPSAGEVRFVCHFLSGKVQSLVPLLDHLRVGLD